MKMSGFKCADSTFLIQLTAYESTYQCGSPGFMHTEAPFWGFISLPANSLSTPQSNHTFFRAF